MKSKKQIYFQVFFSNSEIINKIPLFSTAIKELAENFFQNKVKASKNIIFPVHFTSTSKEIKKKRFFLVLVEKYNGEQKILKYRQIFKEETFYMYGNKKRWDIMQIFENICSSGENFIKVYKIKNKVVFIGLDGELRECVLTKNEDDCHRFYNCLKKISKTNKLITLLFLGEFPNIPKIQKSDLIKKLVAFTGLSHYQFKRKSTRP